MEYELQKTMLESDCLAESKLVHKLFIALAGLFLIFGLADYVHSPEKFFSYLPFRFVYMVFPIAIFFSIDKVKKFRQTEMLGALHACVATIIVTYMIYDIPSVESTYFAGINLIAIAALGCLVFSWKFFWLTAALIYLPYLIMGIFIYKTPKEINYFILNIFYVIGTLFVCILIQYFRDVNRRRNVNTKIELLKRERALEVEVQNREKIINDTVAINVRIESERLGIEAKAKILEKLADQALIVAHDIRGPLTALNLIVTRGNSMDLDWRPLMTEAIERIQLIANDLLWEGRQAKKTEHKSSDVEKVLHSEIIESKGALKGFLPVCEIGPIERPLMARIQEYRLKTILSNLIRNAVESNKEPSPIIFSIKCIKDIIVLSVQDRGKGIPENILRKVGHEKISWDKSIAGSGNGLGLYSAQRYLSENGGRLVIESQENVGTTVSIYLPRI